MLPDFLIIGAQLGGAGALSQIARKHPDIWMPQNAETHFFDVEHYWERGFVWYERSYFGLSPDNTVCTGEATPAYLMHPEVPARARQVLGEDCKILVSLSDPVTRCYRQYLQNYGLLMDNQRFLDAIERKQAQSSTSRVHNYIQRGMYSTQLKRWLEHFPRENLFICIQEEDLTAERFQQTASELYQFLGLQDHTLDFFSEPVDIPEGKVIHFQEGGQIQQGEHNVDIPAGSLLLAPVQGKANVVRRPSDALVKWCEQWNENQPRQELGETERNNLLNEFFFDEIDELETLLDRSLDCWRD